MIDGYKWTLIDYEWTYEKDIPVKQLVYRAVQSYLGESDKRNVLDPAKIRADIGIMPEEADFIRKEELEFQKAVNGENLTLSEMYASFGKEAVLPEELTCKDVDKINVSRVQIYKDFGEGYSEENSYFIPDAYKDGQCVEVEIPVDGSVKMLRIDPAMCSCICMIREIKWNGTLIPLNLPKMIIVNGQKIKADKGLNVMFETEDPNININIEKLKKENSNLLQAKLEVIKLSAATIRELAPAMKKYWYSLTDYLE